MRKSILITGVGGDIGQSILKCLKGIECEVTLFGCDVDNFAAGRNAVDLFFQAPHASDSKNYFEFVKNIMEKESISCIIPTTEIEIEFYNERREFFGKKTTVLINKSALIKMFFDKYETFLFLKNNDLPHPKTFLIDQFQSEMPFPVLLKQRRGWGAKGVLRIENNEELSFYKKRMKDAFVQEIVGGPDEEYTMGVFSTGRETYSIGFKRYLGYGSLTKYAQLVQDGELTALAQKIAKASSLEGSINVQLRKGKNGYVPFEINPRFSSTVYVRHCFGFKDVKWWIDLKEGRVIEYVPTCTSGVAVRTIGETFFDLETV